MGLWKWLTGGEVCYHTFKMIDANVTSNGYGWYAACATVECTECKRRVYHTKGNDFSDHSFASIQAGRVWIESLLPADSPRLEWTKTETT